MYFTTFSNLHILQFLKTHFRLQQKCCQKCQQKLLANFRTKSKTKTKKKRTELRIAVASKKSKIERKHYKHIIKCIVNLKRNISYNASFPEGYPSSTPTLPLVYPSNLGVPLLSPINCKQALQCLGVRRQGMKFAHIYKFSANGNFELENGFLVFSFFGVVLARSFFPTFRLWIPKQCTELAAEPVASPAAPVLRQIHRRPCAPGPGSGLVPRVRTPVNSFE